MEASAVSKVRIWLRALAPKHLVMGAGTARGGTSARRANLQRGDTDHECHNNVFPVKGLLRLQDGVLLDHPQLK
jgi:hypothetical protein